VYLVELWAEMAVASMGFIVWMFTPFSFSIPDFLFFLLSHFCCLIFESSTDAVLLE